MTRLITLTRESRFAQALIFAGMLLTVARSATAQVGRSGVTGTAVDESGAAVANVEITLRPVNETAAAIFVVKTDKRGRFANRFLTTGRYLVEVKNRDRYFIKSGKVKVKDAGGMLLTSYDIVSHPKSGFGTIPVQGGQVTELQLVITGASERERLLRQVEGGSVQREVKEIVDLVNAGELEKALARGKEIMAATTTELPDVLHVVGATYARLQRYSEAEPLLRRAVQLAPEETEFSASLGTMLLASARQKEKEGGDAKAAYAEAEKWLSTSVAKNDSAPSSLLMNYAAVLEKTGKSDAALEIMKRIASREPENVVVRLRMASLFRARGQADKALEILKTLPGGGDPRAVDSLYNVAVAFYNAEDYESALAAVQRAAELDAKHAEAQRLMSRIYYAAGDHGKALLHLRRFVELAPTHPDVKSEREMVKYLEKTTKPAAKKK